MCQHLSRLDRLDGLVCSLCEDGGPVGSARFEPPNVAHRARRNPASAVRGILRFLAPYVIVAASLVIFIVIGARIEAL